MAKAPSFALFSAACMIGHIHSKGGNG